jgi:predicted DCC family thiol-disulfide oxidoreductase YuxK
MHINSGETRKPTRRTQRRIRLKMPAEPYIVFYDARCRLCERSRQSLQSLDASDSLRFIDINNPSQMAAYPMVDPQLAQGQIHVLNPHHRLTGGYDALVELTPALPSLRPLSPLLKWKPIRAAGRSIYQWIARNRYRLGGVVDCETTCNIHGAVH